MSEISINMISDAHDAKKRKRKEKQDLQEHLFGKCEKLKDLYMKYDLLKYE